MKANFYDPLNTLLNQMEQSRRTVSDGNLAFTPAEDKTDYYRLVFSKSNKPPSQEENKQLLETLNLLLRLMTRKQGYVLIELIEIFKDQQFGKFRATIIKWRMVRTNQLDKLNMRESKVSVWWLAHVADTKSSDMVQLDQLNHSHEATQWQQKKII